MRNTIFIYFCSAVLLSGIFPRLYSQANKWKFQYQAPDDITPSEFDIIRDLNPPIVNGQFIEHSNDGEGLELNGEPFKLWSVNSSAEQLGAQGFDRQMSILSRLGVNCVRIGFSRLPSTQSGSDITDINPKGIDNILKTIFYARKHKVRVLINLYSRADLFERDLTNWGIEGYTGNISFGNAPTCLYFFNNTFREAYFEWIKTLVNSINTYYPSGEQLMVKDDPTVLGYQFLSEESLMFWGQFDDLPNPQKALAYQKFTDWAISRYGTYESVRTAWGNDFQAQYGDNANQKILGLYPVWELVLRYETEKSPTVLQRLKDQSEFYLTLQHNFFTEAMQVLRGEACQQNVYLSKNWYTAFNSNGERGSALSIIDRWSDAATTAYGKNYFFEMPGVEGSFEVKNGLLFASQSSLDIENIFNPLAPIMSQIKGKTSMLTSTAFSAPNANMAEYVPMAALYSSLHGVDMVSSDIFYYASQYDGPFVGGDFYDRYFNFKPIVTTSFPAFAVAYREGFITEGKAAVIEQFNLNKASEMRSPMLNEFARYDNPFQITEDPKALFVGKHIIEFLGGPGPDSGRPTSAEDNKSLDTPFTNYDSFIDSNKKLIVSNTGEIRLDYGTEGGLSVQHNNPFFQALVWNSQNSPGKKAFDDWLDYVSIDVESGTRGSVALVTLDGIDSDSPIPVNRSSNLLLQVNTEAYPTSWQTKPESYSEPENPDKIISGERVLNVGQNPWEIVNADLTIKLLNPGIKEVYSLDHNGVQKQKLEFQRSGDTLILTYPSRETFYVSLKGDRTVSNRPELPEFSRTYQISPNPVDKNLIIKPLNQRLIHNLQVVLYSLSGEEVRKYSLKNIDGTPISINVSEISSGIYIVKISDGEIMESSKVLID